MTCSEQVQSSAVATKKAKAPVGLGVLSGRRKAKAGKLPKGASSLIGKWQAVQQVRFGAATIPSMPMTEKLTDVRLTQRQAWLSIIKVKTLVQFTPVQSRVSIWLQDLKAAEEAEQAAEEVAADPHAVERKKLAEAEEWRLQQLRTGQAGANANFQVRRFDVCSPQF